jgi:hypothetical protein
LKLAIIDFDNLPCGVSIQYGYRCDGRCVGMRRLPRCIVYIQLEKLYLIYKNNNKWVRTANAERPTGTVKYGNKGELESVSRPTAGRVCDAADAVGSRGCNCKRPAPTNTSEPSAPQKPRHSPHAGTRRHPETPRTFRSIDCFFLCFCYRDLLSTVPRTYAFARFISAGGGRNATRSELDSHSDSHTDQDRCTHNAHTHTHTVTRTSSPTAYRMRRPDASTPHTHLWIRTSQQSVRARHTNGNARSEMATLRGGTRGDACSCHHAAPAALAD